MLDNFGAESRARRLAAVARRKRLERSIDRWKRDIPIRFRWENSANLRVRTDGHGTKG